MRVAAFSDVHGDVAALRRVLAYIEAEHADVIANLGDTFAGDLFPRATADLLSQQRMLAVRGNHERIMAGSIPDMPLRDRAAASALSIDQMNWVRGWPTVARPRADVLLVHGSPGDDTIGLLETSTSQGLRVASEVEIAARLEGEGARLVLCGHTHVPRMHRRLSGQLILCPGSVHRPLIVNNPALPCAGADASCFAVATDATGRWEGELIVIDGERGTRRYTTVTA